MKIKSLVAAALFTVIAPFAIAAPSTNLIVNGGFENSAFAGAYQTLNSTTGGLSGWAIEVGSVDLINTYWQAAGGNYSLDLSGSEDGVISQTFATIVGQKYAVSFSMAGNPDNTDSSEIVKTLQVGLAGIPLYSFDTTGKSAANMGWETKSFQFTAAGTSSKLFFASMQDSPWGPALDNVSVTAVPEPETYALFLAGLGLMGAVARRRRNNASK